MTPLTHYHPPNQDLWKGRDDEEKQERFCHFVKICDLSIEKLVFAQDKLKFGLIGFASDKGVRKNYGREGAFEGPRAFRKALASLPLLKKTLTNAFLFDFGDIECREDLEASQQDLGWAVEKITALGLIPLVIGGGHEVAYGHWLGLSKKENLSLLNYDAHFDLRSAKEGGSSGTPFWQIHQKCQEKKWPFSYACLGVQSLSNTLALFETADQLKVDYLFAEELIQGKGEAFLELFLLKSERIYLTLDLDIFSASFAPGVSAVNPFGVTPWQILPLLKQTIVSRKVISFNIAELNPKYDKDGRTAKLAAFLFAHLLEFFH